MGAAFFDVAEVAIEKSEAEKLSAAIKDVGKYYAMEFDPKKVAIANLLAVAGGIYGTRFVAYRLKKKIAREKGRLVAMPSNPVSEPAPKVNGAARPIPTESSQKNAPKSPSELWPESGAIAPGTQLW